MRKKRIFGPKRSHRTVRFVALAVILALISAFSFSAGYYLGEQETSGRAWADTPQPFPRHLTF